MQNKLKKNKKRTLRYATFVLLLAVCIFRGYAYDDPAFADITVDPRARALGTAVYALDIGSSSVMFNPAAYRFTDGWDLYSSYTNHYGLVQYGTICVAAPKHMLAGISYSIDDYYRELYVKLAYVRENMWVEGLSLSAALTFMSAGTYGENPDANVDGKGWGVSPEIAAVFRPTEKLSLSLQIRDAGGFLVWDTEARSGYTERSRGVYTEHREIDVINGYAYKLKPYLTFSAFHRNFASYGAGVEYGYKEMAYARLGVVQYTGEDTVQKVSCGIGVKYMKYRADMGYEFSRWENTVVLGIGLKGK